MKSQIVAAFALAAASSLNAQTVAPAPVAVAPPIDLGTTAPIEGNWIYSSTAGTEATFVNASAMPQMTIRCSVATRQVAISKPATIAAPVFSVWTSAETRSLPASFDPSTGRATATLSAYDPFLDNIAFSRGRIALIVSGQPTLVVPAWAELSRVIEDCRA